MTDVVSDDQPINWEKTGNLFRFFCRNSDSDFSMVEIDKKALVSSIVQNLWTKLGISCNFPP